MPNGPKRFWLIAGPNGVRKTTYTFKNVPAFSGSVNFVNLDEIARGLAPLVPRTAESAAARIALQRAREFMARGDIFTMETTLSGQTHLALMRTACRRRFSSSRRARRTSAWSASPAASQKAGTTCRSRSSAPLRAQPRQPPPLRRRGRPLARLRGVQFQAAPGG